MSHQARQDQSVKILLAVAIAGLCTLIWIMYQATSDPTGFYY